MPVASFLDLCLDASSADRMEPFWAAVLGREIVRPDNGSVYLEAPGSPAKIWVNEVPEPKAAKNRVHLDVHCLDVGDLVALGAVVERPPSEDDSWWSMRSPDGDEFCAFVRDVVPANRLYEVVVDAVHPVAQATWWGELLGAPVRSAEGGDYLEGVAGMPFECLVFGWVPEPKIVKNRVHWDVRADIGDVLRRGATLLRGLTVDEGWHVVADPEGNEFCVFPAQVAGP